MHQLEPAEAVNATVVEASSRYQEVAVQPRDCQHHEGQVRAQQHMRGVVHRLTEENQVPKVNPLFFGAKITT